ncbi:hypothetical protein Taro_012095 [Colocasia esculenta]|uniref:Uncharacterized protein n=1 Tax=Colocasia esculenta TaxID=4460 RepID=A0A843UEM6_COLES|nr:hypothetical protein [Colocasia esculenta]
MNEREICCSARFFLLLLLLFFSICSSFSTSLLSPLLGLDPHVILDGIDGWLEGLAASDEIGYFIASVQSHPLENRLAVMQMAMAA